MPYSSLSRSQLRQQIKALRDRLTLEQQQQASQHLIPQALDLIEKYQATQLAFYLPFGSEISPLPLMKILHQQGKSLYLPILHPFASGHLLFQKYDFSTPLVPHHFGMKQPKLNVREVCPLDELEMIFTPLLACDKRGERLGYGGGFYDRTLAQTSAISVGIAHHCQMIENVPTKRWDMPLTHILLG